MSLSSSSGPTHRSVNMLRYWLATIFIFLFILKGTHCDDGNDETTSTSPVYYQWIHSKFEPKTILIPKSSPSLDQDFKTKYTKVVSADSFVDYSQATQSSLVLKLLNYKMNGYYVELAANDWKDISNSLSLETFYNWTGICIEPNPEYLLGLLSHRKCTVYTNPVSTMSNERVHFNFQQATSGIIQSDYDNKEASSSSADLHTTTLMSILTHANAPTEIDFLSLDVEGAEFDALRHFDFGLYQIKVLTIERPSARLHNLLVRHGYWWLTQLLTNPPKVIAFGEMVYIHRLLPGFHEFMKSFRESTVPNTSYFNGGDASYVLTPAWPIVT